MSSLYTNIQNVQRLCIHFKMVLLCFGFMPKSRGSSFYFNKLRWSDVEVLLWTVSMQRSRFAVHEKSSSWSVIPLRQQRPSDDQGFKTHWTSNCLFACFAQLDFLNRGHYKNCFSSSRAAAFIPDWNRWTVQPVLHDLSWSLSITVLQLKTASSRTCDTFVHKSWDNDHGHWKQAHFVNWSGRQRILVCRTEPTAETGGNTFRTCGGVEYNRAEQHPHIHFKECMHSPKQPPQCDLTLCMSPCSNLPYAVSIPICITTERPKHEEYPPGGTAGGYSEALRPQVGAMHACYGMFTFSLIRVHLEQRHRNLRTS